jgi:hypothetical protein
MKNTVISQRPVIILVSVILLFTSGCITEPALDKGKLAELDRASRDLKAALGSGESCEIPDTVLQKLVTGIAAVKDKTASKAEADLLAAYANLVTISRDGLLICRSRTHLSGFEFVPKGRIYVTQDLDPLVEKYGLATEGHVYKPTGAHWKSISRDSIRMIWEKAEAQIKSIEVMLQYG